MKPLLSIIVPVYNVEPYIRQCMDSLIRQTFTDMEIVVIDDGSPDNCGAICDEYAEKDRRVRAVHQKNGGLSAARNRGIAEARGKWLAFVDSDDWCDDDYYEKFFRALGDREVDVFCANSHVNEYPGGGETVYSFSGEFDYLDRDELDALMARTLVNNPGLVWKTRMRPFGTPWDKLFRADFVRENRLLFDVDSRAMEDALFNYQAFFYAKRVAGGEVAGYHFRVVADSITHKYNPNRLKIDYGFLEKTHDLAPEKLEKEFMRRAFYAMSIHLMSDILRLSYLNPANTAPDSEIRREIRDMTRLPYFQDALRRCPNHILTIRHLVLKYLLKQPFLWPLKLAYRVGGNG